MSGNQRLSDQLKFHWKKFILSFSFLSKGWGINGLACTASIKREKGWGNSGTRGARGIEEEGARGIPRAPSRSRAPDFPHPFPLITPATQPIYGLEVRSILQRKQWGLVNRPIPSSENFHFQNQAVNGFALSVTLKQRLGAMAYPCSPSPMSRPGQAGLLLTGAQWKSRAYYADLVMKLKGISEGKPNMTENQPKISNYIDFTVLGELFSNTFSKKSQWKNCSVKLFS